MKILIGLLLSASLLGCATPKVVYLSSEPHHFQITKPLKERAIRVHPDDVKLYKAYIDKLREQIDFHNAQIEAYYKTFEDE